MRKKPFITIGLIVILLIVLASVYYFFIYAKECATEECFLASLEKCERATYTAENNGNIWTYTIQNPFGFSDTCTVKVTNIAIASESQLAKGIVGKSMSCKIPTELAGAFIQIHSKLEFCSGPLKESLQDLLIDQLYKFIVQHIGEITEEIRGQVQ